MTFDFTNKSDREKLHELVKKTIEGHRNNIKLELTVNSLKCIERLIETQERIIEDQEERIAIMTEGGHIEIIEELLEKYRNAESGNIWEHSCRIHEDEAELDKEIEEYRRRAGIKPPKEGDS